MKIVRTAEHIAESSRTERDLTLDYEGETVIADELHPVIFSISFSILLLKNISQIICHYDRKLTAIIDECASGRGRKQAESCSSARS